MRLGTIGFGGPIALVGYMQRDLVERSSVISEQDYKEGLALAQLAPGPLAAQLAMYLGWVRGGVWGATAVGTAFVAPSFLMVLAISILYLRFGGLPWMRGAFYGIGAAVIAIIARSAWKLTRMTLRRDSLLWALFAVNAFVVAWKEAEILWVFFASGFIALAARAPLRGPSAGVTALGLGVPPWLISGMHGPAGLGVLGQIFIFFAKAGAVVFGSGLAIVPFLYGGVVGELGWLGEREFLDAVAVSMITPGPVVITVAFIGYLTAGPLGATLAALGVFLPVFLAVVIAAPHFRRWIASGRVVAFVDGVTAAATGAIAGAAFVLGRRALVDPTTVILALAVLVALRARRVPDPLLIIAAGMVGIVLGGERGL